MKREFFDVDGNKISRKYSKKLKRKNRRPVHGSCTTKKQRHLELCSIDLINPVVNSNLKVLLVSSGSKLMFLLLQGLKCAFKLCKICCRDKCYAENIGCIGHKWRHGYMKDHSNESATLSDGFRSNKELLPNCA